MSNQQFAVCLVSVVHFRTFWWQDCIQAWTVDDAVMPASTYFGAQLSLKSFQGSFSHWNFASDDHYFQWRTSNVSSEKIRAAQTYGHCVGFQTGTGWRSEQFTEVNWHTCFHRSHNWVRVSKKVSKKELQQKQMHTFPSKSVCVCVWVDGWVGGWLRGSMWGSGRDGMF